MDRKLTTANELERMSPAEQQATSEASIVWNLSEAPQALVDRGAARALQRIDRPHTDE